MASKQGNWVVRWGGGVLGHSRPSSGFITFLHSEGTLYLFLSFFLQKVVAALQEAVVLVGKNTQLGTIDLGR
jgi:hypothetical protein